MVYLTEHNIWSDSSLYPPCFTSHQNSMANLHLLTLIHPCPLRPYGWNVDSAKDLYHILIVMIDSLIWSHFENMWSGHFQCCWGKRCWCIKKWKFGTDLFCYKKLFEFAFMFCGHFSSGSGLKSRIESELKLDTGCLPNVF